MRVKKRYHSIILKRSKKKMNSLPLDNLRVKGESLLWLQLRKFQKGLSGISQRIIMKKCQIMIAHLT